MTSKTKTPQRTVPPNDVRLTVRVPAVMMEKIADAALEAQSPVGSAVRRLIARGLEFKGKNRVAF